MDIFSLACCSEQSQEGAMLLRSMDLWSLVQASQHWKRQRSVISSFPTPGSTPLSTLCFFCPQLMGSFALAGQAAQQPLTIWKSPGR